ncbi:Oidioi.mRNA.OKI2018_I69.chr2.g4934.t1.cds [Oikopleura dioica]|uniref:Oidioi.mRNA.OKI2018_I69.chr2.g4934.t1.cds n=1 Tax=Oikopleura dioica TaxID=34765 RepID=A0ABN7T4G3_OIKDI|nr:Oidioi.mRNA.OKI2018_I69.chr2.g4934.t1.cds [Oikopleura dioica]
MRHGEYVALGKVEAALKTSAAIANVVIYGSGAILMPIAIACPVEKVVREWADEIGVKGDLVEICNDEKIVKKMMEEIQATAKSACLSKLEIPNKVHIDGSFEAGWLPDTGLVTDAFKLKRKQLNEHYADVIARLTA